MKTFLFAASVLALSSNAFAADVGMSLSVGQPGFYGRIDIGDYPPPQVIYRQPVIVERPAYYVPAAPIYLNVPPGHSRNWARYCRVYHACGQQVYFVQNGWYNNYYAPHYRERHGVAYREGHREWRPEPQRGHGPGPERGHGHGGGEGHGGHGGNGHGHGNEHGHGRGRD